MNWHDISTIPDELKDGRRVMLWSKAYGGPVICVRMSYGWCEYIQYDEVTDATKYATITPPNDITENE